MKELIPGSNAVTVETNGVLKNIGYKVLTEGNTHASRHAVGGADTVFPADPGADKYLMWDDTAGEAVWADAGGGSGDMTKAVYDPNDDGVIAAAQLDPSLATTSTKLDDFATPDDNTDLNANTTNHGLLVKATAPAAGLVNVVGIANAETAYTNKALFDATVPTTNAPSDAAAAGVATVAARRDHQHANPATWPATAHNMFSSTHGDTTGAANPVDGDTIIGNVTPKWSKLAISIPAANVRNILGVDNGELRPSWKAIFDSTNPAALGTAGPGTSLIAAHRDHVHANNVGTIGITLAGAESSGTDTTALRTDAIIQAFDGTNPSTQAFGDAAAVGVINYAARRDHKHAMMAKPAFDYQVFTGSDTWTKPAGCTFVYVECIGGGGNGAAGGVGTGAGNGGGGGGARAVAAIPAASLGDTESVTVGGAAGTSSFGVMLTALGGSNAVTSTGGDGGTAMDVAVVSTTAIDVQGGSGANGDGDPAIWGGGGGACRKTVAGAGQSGGGSIYGGGGGGSGGYGTSDTTGGAGGKPGNYAAGGAANGGATNGGAGGAGTAATDGSCGGGGGGGGAQNSGVGGAGGAGAIPGGGGGGGGSGSTTGGAAGAGARGEVRIWSY